MEKRAQPSEQKTSRSRGWLRDAGFLVAVGAASTAAAQEAEPARERSGENPNDPSRQRLLDIIFEGQRVGQITAEFQQSGALSIGATDFHRVADSLLAPQQRALLDFLADNGRLTPFEMQSSDLALVYDEQTSSLILTADASQRSATAPSPQAAAPALPAPVGAPLPVYAESSAPLVWNGVELGHIDVRTDSEGRVTFATDRFTAIAGSALNARTRELLPVLEIGGRLSPFVLESVSVQVRYDEATHALVLDAPQVAPAPQAIMAQQLPLAQQVATLPPPREALDMAALYVRGQHVGDLPISSSGEVNAAAFVAVTRDTISRSDAALIQRLQRNGRLAPFELTNDAGGLALRWSQGRLELTSAEAPLPAPTPLVMASAVSAEDATGAILAPRRTVRPPPLDPSTPASLSEIPEYTPPPPVTVSALAPLTPISATPAPSMPAARSSPTPSITADAPPQSIAPPRAPPPPMQAPRPSPEPFAPRDAEIVLASAAPAPSVTIPPPNTAVTTVRARRSEIPAPPSASPSLAPNTPGRMDFIFPLMMDGRYLGDVGLRFGEGGAVTVPGDRVLDLLRPSLTQEVLELIAARATDGRLSPFADEATGVALVYDDSLQELRVDVPGSLRQLEVISVSARNAAPDAEGRLLRPAPVSAFVSFDATQSYDHSADDPSEPLVAQIETGVRLFGDRGVFLTSRGVYQEDADQQFQRGETRLIYDHVPSMISVTAGDLRYSTSTFQAAPPLGGIAVERLFSLQPLRNFRPAGRQSIVLDRRTTVTVTVNGVEMRRVDLLPGRYNIEDLPFVEGSNDVSILLEDELGRREVIDLRGYYDVELLRPGLSEFSYVIGAPSTSEAEGITYDTDVLQYSMFHRIGVLSNLTLGVNAQGLDRSHLFGAEVLTATPIGSIGLDWAHSVNPDLGEDGDAALLRYDLQPPRNEGGLTWSFGFTSEWQSETFAPVGAELSPDSFELQNDASLRFSHPEWGSLTLSGAYDIRRGDGPERSEAAIGYSRQLWGNLYGSAYLSHEVEGDDQETSGSFQLSLRLGRDSRVTGRYNSRSEVSEVEWSRSGSSGIGSVNTSLSVGADHATGSGFAGGSLGYYGNRFEATVTSEARTVGVDSGELQARTSLRVGTGVAYAGGHAAVGRPVRGAFAIVTPHESLEDHQIYLGDDGAGRPRAQTGWFGPALVPDISPYIRESLAVDVNDLPAGYDLGSGQLDFLAYRGAGYDVRVGSAATVTILATLVDERGAPLSLVGGALHNLDNTEADPIQTFTNRGGRFAASGVAPGRYRLVLFTDPPIEFEITIEEGAVGLVQLGTMRIEVIQ